MEDAHNPEVGGVQGALGVSLLPKAGKAQEQVKPSSPQVTVTTGLSGDPHADPTLQVSIAPGGKSFPGIQITPAEGKAFDLSKFGHITAKVTNTGESRLSLAFRVDNAGDWHDEPWNTESALIEPGKSKEITVIFGYHYGQKPGYKLDPSKIVQLYFFANKVDAAKSFRIDTLEAGGESGEKPTVNPADIRVEPVGGKIYAPGDKLDPAKQIVARNAVVTPEAGGLAIKGAPKAAPLVHLKCPQGSWDLRQYLQVTCTLKNTGAEPMVPAFSVVSRGGPSAVAKPAAPLAPGASTQLTVSFIPEKILDLGVKESLTTFTSDNVGTLVFSADAAPAGAAFTITGVTASVPAPSVPEWLGKRPPVEGDWVQTLSEEFDSPQINTKLWNRTSDNWWDPKKTHYSKENVLLQNGKAILRYEKKRGRHNDSPDGAETPYATGYLNTYAKWTQRYGYFEARQKLPQAPGLWPGFWLIPDRGPSLGDSKTAFNKRQSTDVDGMEFDILEHLTRWGPYRYNVAHHWDGYGKNHKANGCERVYVQPDAEGYLTAGLLWLPGQVTYYCNGRPVVTWKTERIASVPAYIIFYLPSGGWDNSEVDDAKLPADYFIDYVRVWQRKDLASPGDGQHNEGEEVQTTKP